MSVDIKITGDGNQPLHMKVNACDNDKHMLMFTNNDYVAQNQFLYLIILIIGSVRSGENLEKPEHAVQFKSSDMHVLRLNFAVVY